MRTARTIGILTILMLSTWSYSFGDGSAKNQRPIETLEALIQKAKPLISTSPDQALEILKEAEKFAIDKNQMDRIARVYNFMNRIYISKSNRDSAIYYGLKGLKLCQKYDSNQLVFSARSLGESYSDNGQLDSALYYLQLAENCRNESNKSSSIHLYVLMEIVDLLALVNDMSAYDIYREKARTLLNESSGLSEMDRVVILHGLLISDLNRNDTLAFNRSLLQFQELIQPFEKGVALPQYHMELFQFSNKSAEDWMSQVEGYLPVLREIGSWKNLVLSYYLLASKKYELNFPTDDILQLIDSCLSTAHRESLHHALASAYILKESVHRRDNNYEAAYLASKSNNYWEDSINRIDLLKNMDALKVQFETEEKENQILAQQLSIQRKVRQRNGLLFGFGLLGLLGLGFEVWRRERIKNKELVHLQSLSEKDRLIAESKMQLMRSQMNPHFLFNSLNSIKQFIIQKPKNESAQYISDFARLMRLNLQNSSELLISLDREIAFLKQYIHMEQMRFKEPFEVNWDIDQSIDLDAYLFPPMLIQPYIENAIWHGLRYKKSGGVIDIHLSAINSENVVCTIQDNGVGRVKSEKIKSSTTSLRKSMGTQITEDRITMTNELLESDIRVLTEDLYDLVGNASGTRVTIYIPFIRE